MLGEFKTKIDVATKNGLQINRLRIKTQGTNVVLRLRVYYRILSNIRHP